MAYMYMLQCADGSLYVGSTLNLEHRIAQHNEGEGAEYTKTRLPVQLLYFEQFDRVDDAYGAEPSASRWPPGTWSRCRRSARSGSWTHLTAECGRGV